MIKKRIYLYNVMSNYLVRAGNIIFPVSHYAPLSLPNMSPQTLPVLIFHRRLTLFDNRNVFLSTHNLLDFMSGFSQGLNRWYIRLRTVRDQQLKYGALILLFLSLIFSIMDGLIFFFGWLSMGVMGILLLYKRSPRYFYLTLWLGSIYIMVFFGSIVTYIWTASDDNIILPLWGYSILLGAFLVSVSLILFVRERRNRYAMEGEYVPIGLWSTAVIAFFWTSLFSIIGWIRWADGSLGNPELFKILYLVNESLLILLLVFILYFPESRFRTTILETVSPGGEIKQFISSMFGKNLRLEDNIRKLDVRIGCPVCGVDLKREVKRCPSCDERRFFYWCDREEDFFVRCPNCRRLTQISNERCIHCSIRISRKIRCSKCRNIHQISKWIES